MKLKAFKWKKSFCRGYSKTKILELINKLGKGAENKSNVNTSVVWVINATSCIYSWQRGVYTHTRRRGQYEDRREICGHDPRNAKSIETGKMQGRDCPPRIFRDCGSINISFVDFCPLDLR